MNYMKYNINMKKLCIILLFFTFLTSSVTYKNIAYSYQQKITYAKVLDNCILYKSIEMNDVYDDMYFYIPESYFVVVLEKVNDSCFKVQYDKYIGYINPTYVILINFTPVIKSLKGVKFDIKDTSGTQIWNKPSASGDVLTTIPAGFKRIEYIAKFNGDIPVGGESSIWYYISYTPFENSTNVYEGYVYSENVTNLDNIVYNSEVDFEIEEINNSENSQSLNINATFKTIIIALITIPIILFFVLIMYKITKKIQENTNKRLNYKKQNYEKFSQFYNIESKNENIKLKSKINDMRNKIYFKQDKISTHSESCPSYPNYDTDDELL